MMTSKGKNLIAALVAALAFVSLINAQVAEKVKLGIYIESLCPDSRRFFLNQFEPTYEILSDVIEPQIVPFGHARTLGNGKMVCQHGARECEGNRQMACVLAKGKSQADKINTIGCLFTLQDSPKDCVEKHLSGVSFEEIEKCKTSPDSYQMMIEAEKATGRVSYIPHLTFDGQHSDEIQQEIEFDLKEFVCKKINGTKPETCKGAKTDEATSSSSSANFS